MHRVCGFGDSTPESLSRPGVTAVARLAGHLVQPLYTQQRVEQHKHAVCLLKISAAAPFISRPDSYQAGGVAGV
jgi:hypothetical protein